MTNSIRKWLSMLLNKMKGACSLFPSLKTKSTIWVIWPGAMYLFHYIFLIYKLWTTSQLHGVSGRTMSLPVKLSAWHMMNTHQCHVFLPLFLSNRDELANSLAYRIVLNITSEQILEPKKKTNKNSDRLSFIYLFI